MINQFTVKSIGKMHVHGETMEVQVEPQYIPALKALMDLAILLSFGGSMAVIAKNSERCLRYPVRIDNPLM